MEPITSEEMGYWGSDAKTARAVDRWNTYVLPELDRLEKLLESQEDGSGDGEEYLHEISNDAWQVFCGSPDGRQRAVALVRRQIAAHDGGKNEQ